MDARAHRWNGSRDCPLPADVKRQSRHRRYCGYKGHFRSTISWRSVVDAPETLAIRPSACDATAPDASSRLEQRALDGYRTTTRCRSPDHRCSPHRDGNADRSRNWVGTSSTRFPVLSVCGKSIERDVAIDLPGIEPRRREIRTVRRIRVDCGSRHSASYCAVSLAIFARHGAVEEIARIELDAGLVGPEFENTARAPDLRRARQNAAWRCAAAQAVVVIVALPDLQLLIASRGCARRPDAASRKSNGVPSTLRGAPSGMPAGLTGK